MSEPKPPTWPTKPVQVPATWDLIESVHRVSSRSRSRVQALRFRVCPLEPKLHAHLSEHHRRGGEVLPGLLASAIACVKPPQLEVAMGDERAHLACSRLLSRF